MWRTEVDEGCCSPHSTFGARRPAIPFAAIWCHLSLHRVPTASSVCKPVPIIVFQNRARQCPTDYLIRSTCTNKQCNNITAALRMLLLFLHAVKKIIIESPLLRAVSRPCSSDEDENGE